METSSRWTDSTATPTPSNVTACQPSSPLRKDLRLKPVIAGRDANRSS